MLCLANITSHENEEETQLLAGEEEDFDYFIDMIEKTWDNPNHAEGGFSLEELVSGLGKMAKNDSNRQLLMDNCGGRLITQLKHIMKKGKIEEKESAVTTVWELAFDDKYKEELKVLSSLMVSDKYSHYQITLACEQSSAILLLIYLCVLSET